MKSKVLAVSILALLGSFAFGEQAHTIDAKIGERIKLAQFGGPQIELVVTAVDQFDVTVTAIDYEHMRFVRTKGKYGYQQPGMTTKQFKRADHHPTQIFHQGGCTVSYVRDMATPMNHAKLQIHVGHVPDE